VRALAAVLVVAVAVGCGAGGGAPRAAPPSDWRSNALGLLEQLQGDLATTQLGGTTRAAAARALADTSQLYALLVAYTDLGGCGRMAADTQAPAAVARSFAGACADLERAAASFARAATRDDPRALARATRIAALAEPGLVATLVAVKRR